MRFVIAAVLAAHGIAHLVGFLVPWGLMKSTEVPYHTTVFAGIVNVGHGGIRAVGVLWLAAACLFMAAAGEWALDASGAVVLTVTALVLSTFLCLADWPWASLGLVVDVAVTLGFVALWHLESVPPV